MYFVRCAEKIFRYIGTESWDEDELPKFTSYYDYDDERKWSVADLKKEANRVAFGTEDCDEDALTAIDAELARRNHSEEPLCFKNWNGLLDALVDDDEEEDEDRRPIIYPEDITLPTRKLIRDVAKVEHEEMAFRKKNAAKQPGDLNEKTIKEFVKLDKKGWKAREALMNSDLAQMILKLYDPIEDLKTMAAQMFFLYSQERMRAEAEGKEPDEELFYAGSNLYAYAVVNQIADANADEDADEDDDDKMDSQGKDAFDIQALRKNISEVTRLLYVAMTRAQQKLCLISSVKDGEEELWMNQTRAARIWKTRSMLDMIMPAVLRRLTLPEAGETKEDALWRLSCVSGKAIAEEETIESESDARIEEILQKDTPMRMYLPEKTESAPLKTSVTTLTQQARILSEDDSEETLEDKRKTEEAIRTFRLSTAPSRPAFLEEEKAEAVNIGTATHRFIRLINLDTLRAEDVDVNQVIQSEMDRMKASGIVTEDEARLIRLNGVVSFFRSDLGRRMLQSSEIEREADFTMKIDPHGSTMVQGIVDCVFKENGEWILIDYKTDHDTNPETFVPRHEMQMNWNRTALERLTRTPVKGMWLFALRAGKAFPVKRINVSPN